MSDNEGPSGSCVFGGEHGDEGYIGRVLELGNVTQMLSYLDDDEKGDFIINDVTGRPQGMLIISESGLYSLVLRSRKPEAKPFRRYPSRLG